MMNWVLVEPVPTFSPGQNVPRSNCYNTRQCTAAEAAMPLVVNRALSLTHSIHAAAADAASGLCCLCQPPHRGREIDKDSDR